MKTITTILMVSAVWLLASCDTAGGMYDNDRADNEGDKSQQHYDGTVKYGTFYVDATSYTKWQYIDLHGDSLSITSSTISLEDYSESGVPDNWDFAMHRYDVKTNGGGVMQTSFESIEQLESSMKQAPDDGWTEDVYSDESITVDMSHMMEGYLVYAPGHKNETAGQWLSVDTSNMPPSYNKSDKVFLYRFADGTCAAIQLKNYMSDDKYMTKGWMTVQYKYPMFVNVEEK